MNLYSNSASHNRWKIHLCTMTEDQHSYEVTLRNWLQQHNYITSNASGTSLEEKLKAAYTSDIALVLLGPTFGIREPLSSFSSTELEVSAATDVHPGKVLVFRQSEADRPNSSEQSEFINRLKNFAFGTFQPTVHSPSEFIVEVEKALDAWQPPEPLKQPHPIEVPSGAAMISSTSQLVAEREIVRSVLHSLGAPIIDYLHAAAESTTPIDRVISWARECHVLILILGLDYGFISPVDGLSVTELEFVTALQAKRQILAFKRKDAKMTTDANQSQFLERVSKLIPQEHIFSFLNVEELAQQLVIALKQISSMQTSKYIPEILQADTYRWYRQQLRRWLGKLPHLTQAEGMPLDAVYVSLQTLSQEEYQPDKADPSRVFSTQSEQSSTQQKQLPQLLEVDEALRRYPRFVLRGDPGAGKSVTLRWYATHAPDEITPVFIRLVSYAGDRRNEKVASLMEYIKNEERRFALMPGQRSAWQAALEAGRGLVLLDALDEVPVNEQMTIAADIQSLATQLPIATRIAVTTRIAGFSTQLGSQFIITQVQPLNTQQQEQLAEQWFNAAHKDAPNIAHERAQRLLDLLKREPRLAELGRTPLLMTFLAALSDSRDANVDDLPTTKALIYRRVLRLVLGQWGTLNQRHAFRHLWLKEQIALELARHGVMQEHGEMLTAENVESALVAVRKVSANGSAIGTPASALLREMNEEDGLLIRQGEEQYSFLHSTFQDYLAATLLAAMPQEERIDRVARCRLNARWEEVSQMLVSELDRLERHKEADEVVWALIRADAQPVAPFSWCDPLRLALLRATRCQGGRTSQYNSAGPGSHLSQTWWHAWYEGVNDYRLYYVVPIAETAFPALGVAANSILKQLQHAVYIPQTRLFAIRAWNLMGRDVPIVNELCLAMRSSDKDTRDNAIDALGHLGQAAAPALDDLCEILNDPEERNAANTLALLGPVTLSVLDKLCKGLQNYNAHGRRKAAWVLGHLGPAAAPALDALRKAIYDSDVEVRLTALGALGSLGAVAGPAAKEVLQIMREATENKHSDRRMHSMNAFSTSAWVLREMGEKVAPILPDLSQDLRSPDVKVRSSVLFLLEQMGPLKLAILDNLCQALYDPEADIRRAAASTIGSLGQAGAPALKDLQGTVYDSNTNVRIAALNALGNLGPAALPALEDIRQALQDSEIEPRKSAILALGHLGRTSAPSVLDTLRDVLLYDSQAEMRAVAAQAMATMGQLAAPALGNLRQALHDVDWKVRYEAAGALGHMGSASMSAIDDLLQGLYDSDDRVRHKAAEAIKRSKFSATDILNKLLPLLQDSNPSIQETVALMIHQLQPSPTSTLKYLDYLYHELREPQKKPHGIHSVWTQGTTGLNGPNGQMMRRRFFPPYEEAIRDAFVATLETIEDAGWCPYWQTDDDRYYLQDQRRLLPSITLLLDRGDWQND